MARGTQHSIDTSRRRAKHVALLAKTIVLMGIPKDEIEAFVRRPGGKGEILGHNQFTRVAPEEWVAAIEIAKEFTHA